MISSSRFAPQRFQLRIGQRKMRALCLQIIQNTKSIIILVNNQMK